jgi:hypothetical protein
LPVAFSGGNGLKRSPLRARHMFDMTAIVSAERIDVNHDVFASVHAGELCFLEVRDHPNVIGLGHEHQGLSRLDA